MIEPDTLADGDGGRNRLPPDVGVMEAGPDPNDVRRHVKRMLTEREYRRRYRRIDFYRPNRRQLDFHNLTDPERMLRAGNQEGKTHAAGAQMAMDAISFYPEWYTGRRFEVPPAIERPYAFIGWAGCTTSVATRDGIQTKLLGDITQERGLGTGLIPLDNIVGRPAMARGITYFVDTVTLLRETGGTAIIRLKTFEMGRKAWQGESVDVVWIDEDPADDEIYGEALARTTTTRGRIMCSMTPVLGQTPVRRRFKTRHPGTAEVVMTIDDCLVSAGGHIPDEDLPRLRAQYKASEIQTRLYGADMQGEGAVFETPIDRIKHTLDPADVPPYWPWLWGLDFRHSGSATTGHPFAAALCCWDRDADKIYVMHAERLMGLAPIHVAAMKQYPMWLAPAAWPHDGGRGASLISGETVARVYKGLGLNMRPTHATFPNGGFNFEAGVAEMDARFATGRLKVAAHLAPIFDEYQGYHRKDGLVVKVDDDALSAIRQAVMDIRFARVPEEFRGFARRTGSGGFARGTPNHPDGDMDCFTGS